MRKIISILLVLISALVSVSVMVDIVSAVGADGLNPGGSLTSGQSITSQNGQFKLIMQGDGNLVLYDSTMKPLWASGTNGHSVFQAIMQNDGNFVIYDTNNKPLWATGTNGHSGAWLIVQNDGNVVVYDSNSMKLWATNINPVSSFRFTRECCIEDLYYVDWYTSEKYFQLPISVEVWDQNLNPVNGVTVHVQIYAYGGSITGNNILKFDQTKSTQSNGIAKFGYSEDSNLYGDSNRLVEIWIDQGNGYQTYMEKNFAVKWD